MLRRNQIQDNSLLQSTQQWYSFIWSITNLHNKLRALFKPKELIFFGFYPWKYHLNDHLVWEHSIGSFSFSPAQKVKTACRDCVSRAITVTDMSTTLLKVFNVNLRIGFSKFNRELDPLASNPLGHNQAKRLKIWFHGSCI